MRKSANRPAAHFEVEDANEAFQKLEDFTRRVLAVPKKVIDRKLAAEKTAKQRRRTR
jgi:hypothetical protein